MNSTGRRRAPWELLAIPRKSWLLVLLIPLALVLAGCGARNLISWGPGWSATAASDGVVFVGTRQGEILALNANKNGNLSDLEQEIWVFTPEKDQRLGGVFGMPAVSKEFIFVADKGTREGGAGRLYALRKDRSSSTTIEISRGEWVRSIEGAIVGGPAAAEAEGIVLVGSDDGNLYAFDMTGDAIGKKWSYPTGGRIWSTPTVGNGTVYFGSMDGNIYALSLEEGLTQAERLKWKYQTDGAVVAKPLLLDGMVIVGSFDKKIYALKADTSNPEGELAWFEPFKGGDWFWAGAVSDGEHIYAPSMDGTVYALDKEGSPIWLLPFKADSPIVSTPVVVEEVVGAKAIVVATDAGRLHLLSARDGDELAIFMDLGSRIKAPLSRDGDTVFVGLEDSTVRGINVRKWGVEAGERPPRGRDYVGFFDTILIDPMLNVLVVLYSALFGNFGLAIILFTIIVRVLTLPLIVKQTKAMRAMTALQPRMREIQQRHAKDPQKRSQETMRLYREAGMNPLGCLGPLIIQMPIWFALYRALLKSLGTNPDDLVGLSQRLYAWNPFAGTAVPLNSDFLWLDLANPDPSPLILPILVGASTWAQQKMTTIPSVDPRQASTNSMMLWMMPLMLGMFTLTFPSGLALYWVVSNLIGVAIHFYITRDLSPLLPKKKATPAPEPEVEPVKEPEPKEIEGDGRASHVRKNRRRGNRAGPEGARRRAGRGRSRNTKPR